VEGEVASAIADQLDAKLSGAEQKAVAEKPTQNAAAYDAYLRGLTIEHNNYNYDAYIEADRNYQRAVELDPNFALAWARMAILRSFLNFNAIDLNMYTADSVKQAADRGSRRVRIAIAFYATSTARSQLTRRRENDCRTARWYMSIADLFCGGLVGGRKPKQATKKRSSSTRATSSC
jgi:hypothetical protein